MSNIIDFQKVLAERRKQQEDEEMKALVAYFIKRYGWGQNFFKIS